MANYNKKTDKKIFIVGAIAFIVGALVGDHFDPIEKLKEKLNLKKQA